jgi:hypothetical protein
MKTLSQNKIIVALLALAGILAMSALASGIRDMKFRDPDPFYFEWPFVAGSSFNEIVQQVEALPIEQIIMFWVVIVALTLIIIMAIDPKYRWKIIMAVIRTAIFFIAMTWALKAIAHNMNSTLFTDSAILRNSTTNLDNLNPPVFTPTTEIPWISYLVSLAITLGFAFLGWKLWNLGTRRNTNAIRQNIADIAKDTLEKIADGRDFGDAVTNCYFRMTDAVKDVRGLERQEGMTPSEFATRLEAAGLPGEPVHRLTRLFEAVRYGAKKPDGQETRNAIVCLNDIIAACGAAS